MTVSHWYMPNNWPRKRSKLNLILISAVYRRYVSVCFTTCLFCTVRWMAVSNRCAVRLLLYRAFLWLLLNRRQLLRQATGAIKSGYRCRSLISLLSTIYGCSISSFFSVICSVFILRLLIYLPAFCVFKQFSARVRLFRLCACLSISILCNTQKT